MSRKGGESGNGSSLERQLEDLSIVSDGEPQTRGEECVITASSGVKSFDCAVCIQPCTFPIQLPCGHIFCYLCVKGFSHRQGRRCALCRQPFPEDAIIKPHVLSQKADETSSGEKYRSLDSDGLWFYEGRNGWWQYDERSNSDLERAWQASKKSCEVLIAGYVYVIDLEKMEQARRNDRSRKRQICRNPGDDIVRKGVAGIMTEGWRRAPRDSSSRERTPQEGSASTQGDTTMSADDSSANDQQSEEAG